MADRDSDMSARYTTGSFASMNMGCTLHYGITNSCQSAATSV